MGKIRSQHFEELPLEEPGCYCLPQSRHILPNEFFWCVFSVCTHAWKIYYIEGSETFQSPPHGPFFCVFHIEPWQCSICCNRGKQTAVSGPPACGRFWCASAADNYECMICHTLGKEMASRLYCRSKGDTWGGKLTSGSYRSVRKWMGLSLSSASSRICRVRQFCGAEAAMDVQTSSRIDHIPGWSSFAVLSVKCEPFSCERRNAWKEWVLDKGGIEISRIFFVFEISLLCLEKNWRRWVSFGEFAVQLSLAICRVSCEISKHHF